MVRIKTKSISLVETDVTSSEGMRGYIRYPDCYKANVMVSVDSLGTVGEKSVTLPVEFYEKVDGLFKEINEYLESEAE